MKRYFLVDYRTGKKIGNEEYTNHLDAQKAKIAYLKSRAEEKVVNNLVIIGSREANPVCINCGGEIGDDGRCGAERE
jgi:hypothetical protein